MKELKKTIIYDIALKKCGRKNNKREQLTSAKALLKNSKEVNEFRPLYHKIYKLDDTFQLLDGFTAIILKDMIEGLELNTVEGAYMDCREIINSCNPTGYEYEKVKIEMTELEQKAIELKKNKGGTIPTELQVHINNLYFNPVYLLRAIKILGTEGVTAYAHCSESKQPIYFKSELGEAIVLPIRPPEKVTDDEEANNG